jgi:arsenite-transporting ATPase
MAKELYGDRDPIGGFSAHNPFTVTDQGKEVVVEMEVPFVEKSELDVFRHGAELYIQIGPYRRSLVLPDSLHRRPVTKATLDGGRLKVVFGSPGSGR